MQILINGWIKLKVIESYLQIARDLSSTSSMYRADIDDECVLDWSDDGVVGVDMMVTLANGDVNETQLQAAGDAEAELFRQPKRA